MSATTAFAAAAAGGSSGLVMNLLPLLLIFAVFWFLLIRPQQKRLKDHRAMVEGLRKGDVVVTAGGLIGKVTKVDESEVTVELAEEMRVRVVRATISEVRSKTEPAASNDRS